MNGSIEPARAAVRPRVGRADSALSHLLDEEVAALLERSQPTTVLLLGPRGRGKTTALAHLAATFVGDPRLSLLDDPHETPPTAAHVTVMASRHDRVTAATRFRLLPWTDDDVLDYLRASYTERIGDVFSRWHANAGHDLHRWPGLCRQVLDEIVADGAADVFTALARVVDSRLRGFDRNETLPMVARHLFARCRASRTPPVRDVGAATALDSTAVQAVLTARHLLEIVLEQQRTVTLTVHWSQPLRDALRHTLQHDTWVADTIRRRVNTPRLRHKAAAHGLLCLTTERHRPPFALRGDCSHAWLRNADLSRMRVRAKLGESVLDDADLTEAVFERCDLHRASLRNAAAERSTWNLPFAHGLRAHGLRAARSTWRRALLRGADFTGADLTGANLAEADLGQAVLDRAMLHGANLRSAILVDTRLTDADLTAADCERAHFGGTDFRAARMTAVGCRGAWFVRCILAETNLPSFAAPGARFDECDLSGACWPEAELQNAAFPGCGLANVDWEGANLRGADFRGATFHLGSSRSGLVDSVVASEGSRTGFYTDESLEHAFQAPEDVRKANLRNCDLRGAHIEGTDFYLVDLRGAKMTWQARRWMQRCRAILDRDGDHSP